MLIFYSIWLNVYFLSRIPLLCYLTNIGLGMSTWQWYKHIVRAQTTPEKQTGTPNTTTAGQFLARQPVTFCSLSWSTGTVHAAQGRQLTEKTAALATFWFASKRCQVSVKWRLWCMFFLGIFFKCVWLPFYCINYLWTTVESSWAFF